MVRDTNGRLVVSYNVEGASLARAYAQAWAVAQRMAEENPGLRAPGVLVQRMDQTFEAKRAKWESEFYDVTKNGARRRRYKRPQIEKDWEDWQKRERAAARAARQQSNAERG